MDKIYRIGKFLFLALVVYGALLAFFALRDLYKYWRLDGTTRGQVQEAQVQEVSTSRYDILAAYTYIYGGQTYQGRSSLGKPYQLNKYSAEKAARDIKITPPTVYFSRHDPNISALTRKFPLKSVLNAALVLGISLYLWVLNLYYAPKKR